MNNDQILREWIDEIINSGYDVFIRDVSFFGFPSFHIIIPGLSELVYPDDTKIRATNTRYYISNLLRDHPEKIDKSNCLYIIATMEYFLGNAYENTMESYYGIVNPLDVPCENIYCGCAYMIAMCYCMLGDYEQAKIKMDYVLKLAEDGLTNNIINDNQFITLLAIKYYISGFIELKDHNLVMDYLKSLFDECICSTVNYVFLEPEKIIVKQYPGKEKNGKSNRELYKSLYDTISHYTYALRSIQKDSFIKQENVRNILKR